MTELSAYNGAERWAAHLSKYWMDLEPASVGTLYIDGHVRVYNGRLTSLPRRYVSRERLCLRGITDNWVNDAIGRPFFVVEKSIDPRLLVTLRKEIVPRLLDDVPDQPSDQKLHENPHLCRFILVFDREGYSPSFFAEMWRTHRVGCLTYHKHPGDPWPEEWFNKHKLAMPAGEVIDMQLCEMGTFVGSGKKAIWMREVLKLKQNLHGAQSTDAGDALQQFYPFCIFLFLSQFKDIFRDSFLFGTEVIEKIHQGLQRSVKGFITEIKLQQPIHEWLPPMLSAFEGGPLRC